MSKIIENQTEGLGLVVTFTSEKGGAGKTTLSMSLSCELAARGYKVTVIETDGNGHFEIFDRISDIENLTVMSGINEQTLKNAIVEAKACGADFIFVDTPGGTSGVSLMSVKFSHFCILPSRLSFKDMRDAIRTSEYIKDYGDGTTPHSIVWIDVPLSEKPSQDIRKLIDGVRSRQNLHVFNNMFEHRNVYDSVEMRGKTLRQLYQEKSFVSQTLGKGKQLKEAVRNVSNIADEMIEIMAQKGIIELN